MCEGGIVGGIVLLCLAGIVGCVEALSKGGIVGCCVKAVYIPSVANIV